MKLHRVFPRWIWGIYLILFAFSIPWYVPSQLEMELLWGLPMWLWMCILAVFLTACFTMFVIQSYWTEE